MGDLIQMRTPEEWMDFIAEISERVEKDFEEHKLRILALGDLSGLSEEAYQAVLATVPMYLWHVIFKDPIVKNILIRETGGYNKDPKKEFSIIESLIKKIMQVSASLMS